MRINIINLKDFVFDAYLKIKLEIPLISFKSHNSGIACRKMQGMCNIKECPPRVDTQSE